MGRREGHASELPVPPPIDRQMAAAAVGHRTQAAATDVCTLACALGLLSYCDYPRDICKVYN